jgi:hypothetical protein
MYWHAGLSQSGLHHLIRASISVPFHIPTIVS